MGPDLDTDQGDGNLESPSPPLLHHPTLALYTTLELQNTARGCITPLTHSLLPTTSTSGSGSTGRSKRDVNIYIL